MHSTHESPRYRRGFKLLMVLVFILLGGAVRSSAATKPNMTWWTHDRFGIFIHWGLYAIPAQGEWYMNNAHIPRKKYALYAKQFDPKHFNANAWVSLFKKAGAGYMVFTTKHHDGFCMFRTKATKYNVVDATPWHTDPCALLAAACKKYGIRFCTYYSIMDWHSRDQRAAHPSPTAPTYDPTILPTSRTKAYLHYMRRQLHELITQYHTNLIWFDGGWITNWTKADSENIYNYIKKLNPNIIVNNRIGNGLGDYGTPEQHIPPQGLPGPWETCMTINNDWGYCRTDHAWKSVATLITNLIHCASGGGNFLLNVGPTAQGIIPKPEVVRLLAMGRWLKINGAAIYGAHRTPFKTKLPFGYATQKPGKLFLEIIHWPASHRITVPMRSKIRSAYMLTAPNKKLRVTPSAAGQVINLPATAPNSIASVLVCRVVEPIVAAK